MTNILLIFTQDSDSGKEYLMGIIRFLGALIIAVIFAFCWSFLGVVIGINDITKLIYWIYGFGFLVVSYLGFITGRIIMAKLIPKQGKLIPETDTQGMKAVNMQGRQKGFRNENNKDN
jgi:hypothetical protein